MHAHAQPKQATKCLGGIGLVVKHMTYIWKCIADSFEQNERGTPACRPGAPAAQLFAQTSLSGSGTIACRLARFHREPMQMSGRISVHFPNCKASAFICDAVVQQNRNGFNRLPAGIGVVQIASHPPSCAVQIASHPPLGRCKLLHTRLPEAPR